MPLDECLSNFAKIFNDVFVLEKPMSVYKYFLTECLVVEMNEPFNDCPSDLRDWHSVPFQYNFAQGTSKYVNYYSSVHFRNFIDRAIREIKRQDSLLGD